MIAQTTHIDLTGGHNPNNAVLFVFENHSTVISFYDKRAAEAAIKSARVNAITTVRLFVEAEV